MNRYMKRIVSFLIVFILITVIYANLNISLAATYNQQILSALPEDKNGIDLFPESYRVALNKLVDDTGHSNWKFRPFYTDIDWNELTSSQNENKCLRNTIYKNGKPSEWLCTCGQQGDIGYYCASAKIVNYYLDPRNFLTEKSIFQFLDLSNSSEVSLDDIQKAIEGTYLAGTTSNGESYAQIIYDAARESGEGAYSIITRIFQELGSGTELPYMISGTDPTYPGVYNFFNYGASDGEGNLQRGLAYAQNAGWTSPRIALIEGAKLIANTYTKAGQINKYLYKFDVVGEEYNQLYNHQYMTNVQDPNSQALMLYSTYEESGLLDNELTFVIPIYKNMPTYVKLPNSLNPSENIYYVSSNYDPVNWRYEPNGGIIGSLSKDTAVVMLQENASQAGGISWGKILLNGQVGYMSMEYLSPVNRIQDVYEVPTPGTQYLGKDKNPDALLSYSVQLQNIGWTAWAESGETLGITGQNRRLETIKISLYPELATEELKYRVHVKDIGWMDWVSNGQEAGTVGEGKGIEAIEIKMRDLGNYDILYRVCIEGNNWTEWVENGKTAGTTGQGKQITAIEIKLQEAEPWDDRGSQYKGTEEIDQTSLISYDTYLKNAGWTGWRTNGEEAGSEMQRRKIEAFRIALSDSIQNEGIKYRVHLQDVGWTDWKTNGEVVGEPDSDKRMEAIQIELENGTNYELEYRVHVQDIGWMDWVQNGEIAGTTGKLKRIEAIQIRLKGEGVKHLGKDKNPDALLSYSAQLENIGWTGWGESGETIGITQASRRLETVKISLYPELSSEDLQYRVYVQDKGWTNWVSDGEEAGTVGESKGIEAIQIKMRDLGNYDILYRACIDGNNWTEWVKNGKTAGTTGQGKQITAIEIKLQEAEPWDDRGSQYKGTEEIDQTSLISYDTYLKNAGWTGWRTNGEEAGSEMQRRKIEAFRIALSDSIQNEGIKYRVHLQDVGWTDWKTNGEVVGEPDSDKRMEAIQIELENGTNYELEYRVHVQDIGWMDWVQNGEIAGTTGKLKRIEAIQIRLIEKGDFDNLSVTYSTHVQDLDWTKWVSEGEMSGTTGEDKRIEAIKIKLDNLNIKLEDAIQYKVHVQDIGWKDWVSDGEIAGTEGESKRIEAIQIKLNEEILGKTIRYRVHVQDIGWMDWVQNGEIAGTEGESKRIEAIEIEIE